MDAITASTTTHGLALDLSLRAPASYRERTTPEQAALDARELQALFGTGPPGPTDQPAANADHRFAVRALGSA
ncbi:MAG: hypothetical protein ACRDXC_03335, partial [Acidimicrobiales bacterium]